MEPSQEAIGCVGEIERVDVGGCGSGCVGVGVWMRVTSCMNQGMTRCMSDNPRTPRHGGRES